MSGLAFRWLFGGSPPNPIRTELLSTSPSSSSSPLTTTALASPRKGNGKDTENDKKMKTPQEQLDQLLEQFKTQDLPPSSRFAGEIGLQKDAQPFTVLGLWRHAWFIAAKGNVSSSHLYLFAK